MTTSNMTLLSIEDIKEKAINLNGGRTSRWKLISEVKAALVHFDCADKALVYMEKNAVIMSVPYKHVRQLLDRSDYSMTDFLGNISHAATSCGFQPDLMDEGLFMEDNSCIQVVMSPV